MALALAEHTTATPGFAISIKRAPRTALELRESFLKITRDPAYGALLLTSDRAAEIREIHALFEGTCTYEDPMHPAYHGGVTWKYEGSNLVEAKDTALFERFRTLCGIEYAKAPVLESKLSMFGRQLRQKVAALLY